MGPMRRAIASVAVLTTMVACTSAGGDTKVRVTPAVNATDVPGLPASTTALPDVTYAQFHELLGRLRGVPVVLNVWGSWCGPCREEGPRLAAAARTYGHRVQFLGLDVKDDKGPAQKFIQEMGWTYPSVFDPSPTANVETQLGWRAQPVTLFYDSSGKIVDQVSGPVTAADLRSGIGKILA